MKIHGRNGNGWRISWYRRGRKQWTFIVWPREVVREDGSYSTEHPLFRDFNNRPIPHYEAAFGNQRQCEEAADVWLVQHAGRAS